MLAERAAGTVREKRPASHPTPCLRDIPFLALQTSCFRQGGRGIGKGVRCQQTSSLFYTGLFTSAVAPSDSKPDGWQVLSVNWWSQKVPAAVATRMFLASNLLQQRLRFACSRHSFFQRDSCLHPFSCGFYSHFSCQTRGEGEKRYLTFLRVQIHAFQMFAGDQKWELLRPKLLSLCLPSPPSHFLCSYALKKTIYFHVKIT